MDNFERRLAASMKIAAEQRPDVEPESITHRSNTRRAGFMALAAAVIIGAVIAGTTWLFNPSDSPSPSAPVGDVINLEGEWTLIALNDADGRPLIDIEPGCVDCIPPLAERGYSGPDQMLGAGLFGPSFRPVHLTFEGGRLTGTAGCAKFSASYKQANGQSLTFSDLRRVDDSGRTDCGHPPPTGTPRLLDVRRVSESNGVLSLLAEDGSTIATLERVSTEPISLEGEWVLSALTDADGNELATESNGNTEVTLGFSDGKLTVDQGCNSFLTDYEQSGSRNQDLRFLNFGGMRGVDCGQPPVYDRLNYVRHVSEADGKVQLHAENWMIIAVLERQNPRACTRCPFGSDTGVITGRVVFAGGLSAPQPLSKGLVKFVRSVEGGSAGVKAQASIEPDGTFSTNLPTGMYTVTAKSPEFTYNGVEGVCRAAKPVLVTRNETTSVTVHCNNK